MSTETKDFRAAKRQEIERWSTWWDELSEVAKRAEITVDAIDGAQVGDYRDPERESVESAAEAFDALLPIIEQLGGHGYPAEHAAEMLRRAADRIESD